MLAARFFLAFDQESDIYGQAAIALHEPLNCLDQDQRQALVVCRSTRIDVATANLRLEWRRLPFVQGVRGLDVVVSVHQQNRLAGSIEPVTVDERIRPRPPNESDVPQSGAS